MSTINTYTPRENTPPYSVIPPLKLIPVEHSRIAAFGWLEECEVLVVRLHWSRINPTTPILVLHHQFTAEAYNGLRAPLGSATLILGVTQSSEVGA